MQTFLPHPGFARSAAVLDGARLGKQRVETLQILRALTLPDYGWANHPAVLMWRGFTPALVVYGLACVEEWVATGRADSTRELIAEFAPEVVGRTQDDLAAAGLLPPWVGDEQVHRSHRSALLRKDPGFYHPLFGDEPTDLDYVWPGTATATAPVTATAQGEPAGTPVHVVRPRHPGAVAQFLAAGIVGLGTESGIDVDVRGAAPGSTLRDLLKEIAAGRRPGKDLRVLQSFVDDVRPGDGVALLIEDDRALLTGTVTGEYGFDPRRPFAPHARTVRWGGRAERTDVRPPALLQDPRTLFTVHLHPPSA
ncbi:MSMEG_6728 family protein [Kineococcus gynurae]|uniref:MSMEG_6728 family protein n=1 Tax=Kineococcus gynurae TaxID=452979 RepID=A0ABV5LUG5_9ACTN